MNTRVVKLVLLVILLTLTGCQRPAGNDAVSTSVAATLISMEDVDAVEPTLPVVPSATPWVEDPTESSPTPTPGPLSDEEAIAAAMAVHLEVDEVSITISENTGELAQGGLEGAYFIAAKEGDDWIIIYAGQSHPYCNIVNPYGFPTDWVPECLADDGSIVQRDEEDVGADIASLGAPTWTDSMDSAGRWYLVSTDNVRFTIDNGYLVMKVDEGGGYDEWGLAAGPVTDFYIEMTARMGDQCSGNDRYGFIFRAPDPSQGYIAEISCDGRFRLYEWDGENYTGIQGWQGSSLILQGHNQENRLGVMAEGSTIKLYANGKLLGEYEIENYPEGRFGLVVGSTNTNDFEVRVDTVSFWDL